MSLKRKPASHRFALPAHCFELLLMISHRVFHYDRCLTSDEAKLVDGRVTHKSSSSRLHLTLLFIPSRLRMKPRLPRGKRGRGALAPPIRRALSSLVVERGTNSAHRLSRRTRVFPVLEGHTKNRGGSNLHTRKIPNSDHWGSESRTANPLIPPSA